MFPFLLADLISACGPLPPHRINIFHTQKNSMGLLRYTLDGTGYQTKAIFVPKEYRGGGSKWADWKKEYDGKSNVNIYEMVLRSRSNTNIKRNRLSASTVRCTKRTRRSEPTASTVRLEKSASTISIPIHGLVSKGEVAVAYPHYR